MAITQNANAITLLSLPLELRQQIYTYIVLSPLPLPLAYIRANKTREYFCSPSIPGLPTKKGTLLYASSGLLRTSRQVKSEVLDVLRLLQSTGSSAWELAMLVCASIRKPLGTEMMAHWIRLPAPPSAYTASKPPIEGVSEASTGGLQIVARFEIAWRRLTITSWRGNAGPGSIVQNLLNLLGNWCQNGLLFNAPHSSFPPGANRVAVDHLTILFVSSSLVDGSEDSRENFHYDQLAFHVKWIVETGILAGYVKKISVGREDKGVEGTWEVEQKNEDATKATASEWGPYGWVPGTVPG